MKMPIKTKVLEHALTYDTPIHPNEIAEKIQAEYGMHKYTSAKHVQHIMDTYCGVAIMKAADVQYDDNGELEVMYTVTDYGRKCEGMIPKK